MSAGPVSGEATPFVAVYYGGTGSSWLLDALDRSPQVLVPAYEPLEPWHWDAADEEKLTWLGVALRPPAGSVREAEWAAWYRALLSCPQFRGFKGRRFRAVGVKLSPAAVTDHAGLVSVLAEAGARVIVVSRENRIKHALSLYRSHEEGRNQFAGGGEGPTPVDLDVFDAWVEHSLQRHREVMELREAIVAAFGEGVLDVAYEEFVHDAGKRVVLDRVGEFLEVGPIPVVEGFRKATDDDLAAAISNLDQVRSRYAGSALERYLD